MAEQCLNWVAKIVIMVWLTMGCAGSYWHLRVQYDIKAKLTMTDMLVGVIGTFFGPITLFASIETYGKTNDIVIFQKELEQK